MNVYSFTYIPPGAGYGLGSKWYAPRTGAPATLPIASGTNALAAGNGANAANTNGLRNADMRPGSARKA